MTIILPVKSGLYLLNYRYDSSICLFTCNAIAKKPIKPTTCKTVKMATYTARPVFTAF